MMPGEAAVMKRSTNVLSRAAVASSNRSHSRAASPRSTYSTSARACGAFAIFAAARRRNSGSADLARQLGWVDGLAALLPDEELGEPRWPREAPDVRDENPPVAPVHDVSPYTRPFVRAAERGAPHPRIAKRRIPQATSHGA